MCETPPFCLARCFFFPLPLPLLRLFLSSLQRRKRFFFQFCSSSLLVQSGILVNIYYIMYSPILASFASILGCEWELGRSKQAREGAAKGSKKKQCRSKKKNNSEGAKKKKTVKEQKGAVKQQRRAVRKQKRVTTKHQEIEQ